MRLRQLRPPFQDLPMAEKLQLILDIRQKRKESLLKPKKTAKKKTSKKPAIQKLRSKLSKDDIKAILAKLQEEKAI